MLFDCLNQSRYSVVRIRTSDSEAEVQAVVQAQAESSGPSQVSSQIGFRTAHLIWMVNVDCRYSVDGTEHNHGRDITSFSSFLLLVLSIKLTNLN